MTWAEYRQVDHAVPYVLDICAADSRLLYFGAQHSFKPDDVQVALIEAMWADVEPTVAFNEGGDPPTLEDRAAAVRLNGEAGLVRHLAWKHRVKVASLDPPRSKVAEQLRKSYSSEQVKLFFLLGAVQTHRRNPTEPFETRMERVFSIFAKTKWLEAPPNTLAELETVYRRYLPGTVADLSEEWFDPQKSETFLNAMSREANDFRDEFMVQLLVDHIRKRDRIFAVVGASHVVRQEDAIRAAVAGLPRRCVTSRSESDSH
jgi:hypothetical protein